MKLFIDKNDRLIVTDLPPSLQRVMFDHIDQFSRLSLHLNKEYVYVLYSEIRIEVPDSPCLDRGKIFSLIKDEVRLYQEAVIAYLQIEDKT